MTETETPAQEVRDGLRDILPALIAGAPLGLVFGALAVASGLSPLEAGLMSALVFGGSSQFAALELWSAPLPVLTIVLSTALINSRMLLMSASLAPKTGSLTRLQRWLGFAVLTDENWAFAERRVGERPLSAWYFLSMCAAFWLTWVGFSVLGALAGPLLGDPARFGGDFIFAALIIGILAGFWRGPSTGFVIAAAGVASALAWITLGSPWHVPVGAGVGIVTAVLAPARKASLA